MVMVAEFPSGKSTGRPPEPESRIVMVQMMVSTASFTSSSTVTTMTSLEALVMPAGNERVTGEGLLKSLGSVWRERVSECQGYIKYNVVIADYLQYHQSMTPVSPHHCLVFPPTEL